jgi:excisionase family DNA binding protein
MSQEEPMVTAKVISEQFAIPRSTLYRLVDEGRIPAEDVTKPWHRRRQLRFKASDVRKAIEDRKPSPVP